MNRHFLITALTAVLSVTLAGADPYSPPPNDPFEPLIADIDNNVAPVFTLAPLAHIYNNDGSINRTIYNGTETDAYVNFNTYPDGTVVKKSVTAKHGTFKSAPVYKDGAYCDDTVVYAQIMLPAGAKTGDKFPGILFLHGGGYYAQNSSGYLRAKAWAAAGYVVVACDLPGIADPTHADVGSGTWRSVPYDSIPRFTVTPDIKASWTYTAEATALKAFALLKNQPNTDQTKMGITGMSWGGFSTTLLCGLLGDRVQAGFSMFGCGFIDEQSAWHDTFDSTNSLFSFNNSAEAAQWLTYLDPGRRAGNIKAHFYIASPASDHFYRPPAAVKTAQAITTAASLNYQFSPNSQIDPNDTNPGHNLDYFIVKSSHNILTPGGNVIPPTFSLPTVSRGWCGMEAVYFDYLLKGIGAPLSTIKLASVPQLDAQNNLTVNFAVTADPLVTLQPPKLYYSAHTTIDTWEHRNWVEPAAPITQIGVNGNLRNYSVTLPANLATQPVDWYVLVSDTRGAWATTVSTPVYNSAIPPVIIAPGDLSISGQPQAATAYIGQTATFTVAAAGSSAVSYQWLKNSVPISGATSASYTTPVLSGSDSGGQFSVTATNASGTLTSNIAILTVTIAPGDLSISSQPQAATVYVGQTAAFTVAAAGSSAVSYQWLKNAVPISGGTSASYTTPAVSSGDNNATYSVVVTNNVGSVTSNAATLAVFDRPIFEADFNASGTGTGGAGNMVTTGGSGVLVNNATISNSVIGTTPFVASSGNYLNTAATSTSGSSINMVTFTPTNTASSWGAFSQGTVNSGSNVNLNGAFDMFIRPNSADTTSQFWFRPVDVANGSTGLRIILNGALYSSNASMQLLIIGPTASIGTDGITYGTTQVSTTPAYKLTNGTIHHIAFSLSTDSTGKVTGKLFGAQGVGPIDTSSSAALLGTMTFYVKAAVVTASPAFSSGAWTMYNRETTASNYDCDTVRMFSAVPGTFSGLSQVPLAPVITSAGAAGASTGTAFSYAIAANNAPTSYGATGLPAGLSLDSIGGLISGTPSATGIFNVGLSAANAQGIATANLVLTVTQGTPTSQTFSQWQAATGVASGPTATPRNDGTANLLKYFHHINPGGPMSAADRAALPVAGVTPGSPKYLTLTYRQYALATGITLNVQTSTDLSSWQSVTPDTTQQTGSDPATNDPMMRVGVDVTGLPRKFIRLNVSLP